MIWSDLDHEHGKMLFRMNIRALLSAVSLFAALLVLAFSSSFTAYGGEDQKPLAQDEQSLDSPARLDFPIYPEEGPHKASYPNGRLKSEWNYGPLGVRLGVWREYYENGQLKSEILYQRGSEEFVSRTYYDNGRLTQEQIYKNGKKDGVTRAYDDHGLVLREESYKMGEREGIFRQFYVTGQMRNEGTYVAGEPEGLFRDYFENGQLMSEKMFKNGVLNGPAKSFSEKGQLEKEFFFKDGTQLEIGPSGIAVPANKIKKLTLTRNLAVSPMTPGYGTVNVDMVLYGISSGRYEITYLLCNEQGELLGQFYKNEVSLDAERSASLGGVLRKDQIRQLAGDAYKEGGSGLLRVKLKKIGDPFGQSNAKDLNASQAESIAEIAIPY